jgi:DNA-binding PadR family transcriptional regulator
MSEEKFELDPSDREQLSLLIREGYINLAGKDSDGVQLYEITEKGEKYFNRKEDETTD